MKRISLKNIFRLIGISLFAVTLIGLGLAIQGGSGSVKAAPPLQTTPIPIDRVTMSNEDCLECHEQPNIYKPLPSGDKLNLTIDPAAYGQSVHGELGYNCQQCHTDITEFPHPEQDFQDLRDVTIYVSQACMQCHEQATDEYVEGAHAALIEEGEKNAAVCGDCHGSHETESFVDSRTAIPKACEQCHSGLYVKYAESVHGEALFEEENLDVPTCADCHGNHNSVGPNEEGFHIASPNICAKCHTDEELMAEYDINTQVFDTFVADFHGTTVTIFEKSNPDQETNKAVCIDCHSAHNIKSPEDEGSTVIRENLLVTCQRCHPDATPGFSDAWLSHYPPDAENHVIVYIVDQFYSILIPGTLGIMGIFVITDFWRNKIRGAGHEEEHTEENDGGREDE